jgi:hypothetical protein
MKVDFSLVRFENINLNTRDGVKLRGFFANKYGNEELLHNHSDERVLYRYPKVQYKVIDGMPLLCGVEEGAKLIKNIGFMTEEICIEGELMEAFQKEIVNNQVEFGIARNYIEYDFLTPWLALNQKNIKLYEDANDMEREEILKKILVGNLLSMSKGLGYNVEEKIYAWIDLKECSVNFKNVSMKGFKGKFKVNFQLPDYLGLGKSVSRGLGTIKKN